MTEQNEHYYNRTPRPYKMKFLSEKYLHNVPTAVLLLAISIVNTQPAIAQSELMKTTVIYREVDGHQVLADVCRPNNDEVRPIIIWFHGGALINGNRERVNRRVMELAEAEGYELVSLY